MVFIIIKTTKTFTPLPVIDFIYEGNHVIYYPPRWSKNITARSTKINPIQKCSVKKKNSMITAIDPYIPMNRKRSTILSFSDNLSSTNSDDVNLNPIKECNPLLEEPVLEELPIVFTNSVDKIENGWEFKPQGSCGLDNEEIDNFVSSDPIYYINDNQTFQEADYVNCDESENPLTVFPTYYDDNQIICNDAIPQQSEISLYQGNECYNFNNEYYIPKENIMSDPFYVDPSMYQEALVPIINRNYFQTEYNRFYQGGSMVYTTFPKYEISNQFNDEQQIAHLPRLLIPIQVPISGNVGISQPQNFLARNQPEPSSIPINNYSYYGAPPSIEPAQYFPAHEHMNDCTFEQSNLLVTSEIVIEPKNNSLNEEINVDICESEEVQVKVSDKPTKCGCYTISVRDIATQFPEIDENVITTIAPEVDELNMKDMETQTICTPKNANRDSSPLQVTYANATKSAKRRNRRKKQKLNN